MNALSNFVFVGFADHAMFDAALPAHQVLPILRIKPNRTADATGNAREDVEKCWTLQDENLCLTRVCLNPLSFQAGARARLVQRTRQREKGAIANALFFSVPLRSANAGSANGFYRRFLRSSE